MSSRRSPGEILTSFSGISPPPGAASASHSASPSRRAAQAIRNRFHNKSPAASALSRGLREISNRCRWTLSSAKPGYGIVQLRDNSEETFWQSDAMAAITRTIDSQAAQPGSVNHTIDFEFTNGLEKVTEIHIFVSYKADESYTPAVISVRIGNTLFDLNEIQRLTLYQPEGWIVIPLALTRSHDNSPDYHLQRGVTFRDDIVAQSFIRTFYLQIANGRDTHIRQVRIYGPRPVDASLAVVRNGDAENWGLTFFNTKKPDSDAFCALGTINFTPGIILNMTVYLFDAIDHSKSTHFHIEAALNGSQPVGLNVTGDGCANIVNKDTGGLKSRIVGLCIGAAGDGRGRFDEKTGKWIADVGVKVNAATKIFGKSLSLPVNKVTQVHIGPNYDFGLDACFEETTGDDNRKGLSIAFDHTFNTKDYSPLIWELVGAVTLHAWWKSLFNEKWKIDLFHKKFPVYIR
ncbi:Anaphase-promoting complex subunit 10 [Perkinsus chesapeaki]|uniref:Anaphase-promoting complex subunit 10 n=1 Tax=Perkinsus chesapeaki TaxID=330153 RepID=A0A7J6LU89_PERCH|nr:Anaphase-promoting complex subunit 10 [Perkinsus chesapeaki]